MGDVGIRVEESVGHAPRAAPPCSARGACRYKRRTSVGEVRLMGEVAIRVEGLGKQYRLGGPAERYSTFRDQIRRAVSLRGLLRRAKRAESRPPFWALKDVSFEVGRGEVVGIIGRNGAGKSTLLKILSRVTEPTEGWADIHGRVGSLLEVGTGFHPELTGRENVYLNGAILGMRRSEIARNFDDIIAFAEVEQFVDTPVKHYSSGMYMRLAFAVAAHLDPEILIVDEVLAVGDVAFQKRCLGKMDEVAKGGRTVLFVSHNMVAIERLCRRVLWVARGWIRTAGPPSQVIGQYLRESSAESKRGYEIPVQQVTGQDRPRLVRARVHPDGAPEPSDIDVNTPLRVELIMWNPSPNSVLNFSINFWASTGVLLFNTYSPPRVADRGLIAASCRVPGDILNTGFHSIEVMVVSRGVEIIDNVVDAMMFEVKDVPRQDDYLGPIVGLVRPRVTWEVHADGNP